MTTQAACLISHLNRGGNGYYWLKYLDGRVTTSWYGDLPRGDYHLYFGVNPAISRKGDNKRATLGEIAAINCVYADFDTHDHTKLDVLEHIWSLYPPPSVIVDSGGGYHVYWLLREPYKLTDDVTRQRARSIQRDWVKLVDADPAACDLNRVLRVPGSKNFKYFPPRDVTIIEEHYDRLYTLDDLAVHLEFHEPTQAAPRLIDHSDAGQHWLAQAMARARPGNRNETGFWLACQLRDAGLSENAANDVMMEYATTINREQGGEDGYYLSEAVASCRSAYSQPRRGEAVSQRPAPAMPKNGNGNGNGHKPEAAAPAPAAKPVQQQPQEPEVDPNLWPVNYLPTQTVLECCKQQEAGDADLLALLCQGRICYDHSEHAWYTWHGHHWQEDKTGTVYQLIARRLAPQYLHAAADLLANQGDREDCDNLLKRASALRNRKRMDNVLFLAARHERLAIIGDNWDTNPWLLGLSNGVIDLKSGWMRPGRPEDYIRSISPVNWDSLNSPCSRWVQFISEIFGGDADLVAFAQRLLGYGITGLTTEHILPILWGEGRNGKSTLLEILADVLGDDLATSSQADAIMDAVKSGEGPRPFVYALRGKRLVWASESNEGRRINAGLVKQLTGGDRLNVRTLHSKPVEFRPTHLLFLLTNHRPHIPADDLAIWERVHLVPFTQRFIDNPTQPNEHKRDDKLMDKLHQELPGILAWLVTGCLLWQRDGLKIPQAVAAATTEYRTDEDTTGQFLAERCIITPTAKIRGSELYNAYVEWCKSQSILPMSGVTFGKQCKKRFKHTLSAGVWYEGIGLAA